MNTANTTTLSEALKLQQPTEAHLELIDGHHSDADSDSTAFSAKNDTDTESEDCKPTGVKRVSESEEHGSEMTREESIRACVDDGHLPEGIRMNSRLQQRPEKYTLVSNQLRYDLIQSVVYGKIKIKNAAKSLGINYSTAKSIVQKFKREGRVIKKTIKPDGEEQEVETTTKIARKTTEEERNAVAAAVAMQSQRFTPLVRYPQIAVNPAAAVSTNAALMQLNYLRAVSVAARSQQAAAVANLLSVSENSAFNQVPTLNSLTAATLAATQNLSSYNTAASTSKAQTFCPLVTIQPQ